MDRPLCGRCGRRCRRRRLCCGMGRASHIRPRVMACGKRCARSGWSEIYTAGFYRPADGDVVIDAGANIGLFAIYIARQNRRCRVVALEPFAENFGYLEANVERAGAKNVSCHQAALGAASGTGTMEAVGDRSLDHVLRIDPRSVSGVPVIPLSEIFALGGRRCNRLSQGRYRRIGARCFCRSDDRCARPLQAHRDGISRPHGSGHAGVASQQARSHSRN